MTDFATPCRWRANDVCRSPKLSGGKVTPSICGGCYCRDHEPLSGGATMAAPLPPMPAICVRRSEDPVHAYKAAQRGLSPLKLWYECSAGVNGGLVCMCQGWCGPGCAGYAVERKTTPLVVFG